MQIKLIVLQALAVSLVASVPLIAEQKADSQRSIESSSTTAAMLVARVDTDAENNPQPPPGIQDFFDRLRGKGKRGNARGATGTTGAKRANNPNA